MPQERSMTSGVGCHKWTDEILMWQAINEKHTRRQRKRVVGKVFFGALPPYPASSIACQRSSGRDDARIDLRHHLRMGWKSKTKVVKQ